MGIKTTDLINYFFTRFMQTEGAELKRQIDEISGNTQKGLSHVGMIIHSTTLDTVEKVIAIYGGTEWSRIEGRFLLGASGSYPVNSRGGESTHTLTVNEIPSHCHTQNIVKAVASGISQAGDGKSHYDFTSGTNTGYTGGSQAHNNMPPYKAVYIWERTA